MIRWQACLIVFFLVSLPVLAESPRPRIAIIIDDLGYERAAGERAIELPGPLAYAVLPGTPRASYLAEVAHAAGKDVLLHLPLQAEKSAEPAEPGNLLLDMSREQFSSVFAENLDSVPHVVGINTHRGSLLTRHPGHMTWLMDEILDRGDLFFVDSYTTAQSIALRMARESDIPSVRRDVFLDPDPRPETIVREFARLKEIASQRGLAVGIGHPYPTTLKYLEAALPGLVADGYELISIGELIRATAPERADNALASGE